MTTLCPGAFPGALEPGRRCYSEPACADNQACPLLPDGQDADPTPDASPEDPDA